MLSTRLARQSCLLSSKIPSVLPLTQSMATMKPISAEKLLISRTEFWAKNKALNRPMSPHLTIYKFQLTSVLSITHRMTGLIQSGILAGVGLGAMVLPGNFPMWLQFVQDLHFGPATIFAAKFLLAWPVTFHLWNGCRHLFWDMGHGFKIPELYKTGWFVVGFSVVTGLALAAM